MVTTDFSASDEMVVRGAIELAARFGLSEVTLFHAHVEPTLTDFGVAAPLGKANEMRDEVVKRLGEWVEKLSTSDVRLVPRTEGGRADHAIIELSSDFDLVVMGSRGHGRAHHFLLGSTTDRVVRGAHCDVWVVRGTAEA